MKAAEKAMIKAVKTHGFSVANYLIRAGVNVDTSKILHLAAEWGDLAAVEFSIAANADLSDKRAIRLSMSDFFASCASLQQQTCHSEANHFKVGSDGFRIPMFAAKVRMAESFADSGVEVAVRNSHISAVK